MQSFIRLVIITLLILTSFSVSSSSAPTPDNVNVNVNVKNSASPKRIVSINLCTDQLLLALSDRQNIVSISHLSAQKDYSYYWDKISGIHINSGLAEEILPLKPDLILAGKYTSQTTVNFLKSFGLRVERVDIPKDIDGVYSTIRKVANLIGTEAKAEELILAMDKKMAKVRLLRENKPRLRAVILAPNNFTPGTSTFKSKLIEIAGFDNIAGHYGIEWYGTLSLEHIVESQPDVLIIDDSTNNKNSLADRLLQHPAMSHGLPNTKLLNMPPSLWNCGGPIIINALDILLSYHAE